MELVGLNAPHFATAHLNHGWKYQLQFKQQSGKQQATK
jgi:hypothetical protein